MPDTNCGHSPSLEFHPKETTRERFKDGVHLFDLIPEGPTVH